jgi:hypothetical protein
MFCEGSYGSKIEGMMVTGNIYWMYSFPAENMNYPKLFQSINLRTDKLAIIPIDWPLDSLMDYADPLLDMILFLFLFLFKFQKQQKKTFCCNATCTMKW